MIARSRLFVAVSAVLLATAADAGAPPTFAIPPTRATPAVATLPPNPPPGAHRLTQFPSRVASARTVGPASIVAPSQDLALERGKGILLHLPRSAATIFVADPDLVDFQTKSASLVYVFGRATGETVIYAADAGGEVLYAGRVRVTQNLSGIRDALARALPNEPIAVTDTGGAVMLSGLVLSAAHAADAAAIARQFVDAKKNEIVLNMLTVAEAAQVNLRVRVAEVNRTVLKSFGINWDAVANSGRFAFGLMTQNPATFAELFTRNKITVKSGNVNAMIDALAQEGLITLLAQPNLTALSGETASFLAGGEFPVPVAATAGSGSVPTITIEFK